MKTNSLWWLASPVLKLTLEWLETASWWEAFDYDSHCITKASSSGWKFQCSETVRVVGVGRREFVLGRDRTGIVTMRRDGVWEGKYVLGRVCVGGISAEQVGVRESDSALGRDGAMWVYEASWCLGGEFVLSWYPASNKNTARNNLASRGPTDRGRERRY